MTIQHWIEIQNLTPHHTVKHHGQAVAVAESPVITGQGVYVNLAGGAQIMHPLDTLVEIVAVD